MDGGGLLVCLRASIDAAPDMRATVHDIARKVEHLVRPRSARGGDVPARKLLGARPSTMHFLCVLVLAVPGGCHSMSKEQQQQTVLTAVVHTHTRAHLMRQPRTAVASGHQQHKVVRDPPL